MKSGIKTFARAVRDGDVDKAEEMLDKVVQGGLDEEEWEGYRRALGGMIDAFSSNNELALPQYISEDRFSIGKIKEFRGEMDRKASQNFRPKGEIGFNSAWADVLSVILEDIEGH